MADSSTSDIDNNSLNAHGINDPLFRTCWRRQSCQHCLQGDETCSWCPISSTCVPNPNTFPILAPINSSTICPLGDKERWELRATPFGCDVSTITFLTAVGAIMSTFVVAGLVVLAVWAWKRVMGWYQEGKFAEWKDSVFGTGSSSRGSDSDVGYGIEEEGVLDEDEDEDEDVDDRERRPLLG